jgi:hypothetical protein
MSKNQPNYDIDVNTLRRFFTTKERGFMGLAPDSARQGDLVCVFGGQVPFVLRRNSLDESTILAGEAYMHGVMDGEGMNGLNNGSYKRESFLFF